MKWILLILTIAAGCTQTVFNKQFGGKKGKSAVTYAAMQVFAAMVFFFLTAESRQITPTLAGFSGAFALVYGTAVFCSLNGLRHGSMAKTSLISSLSLMLPTLYGVFFVPEEDVPRFLIVGLLCLVAALVLVNRKDEKKVQEDRIWYVFVSVLFVSNGMCSIVQKQEGRVCPPETGGIFMALALAAAFVVFTAAAFITEKPSVIFDTVKTDWYRAAVAGVLNGILNLLVIKLNPLLPAVILFPAISAGNVILNRILSGAIFKEKFSLAQNIGFLFGVLTIILLNL